LRTFWAHPTDSTRKTGLRQSRAASSREMTNAADPSQGTSQSNRRTGVAIISELR
jgi:hypothetical protein